MFTVVFIQVCLQRANQNLLIHKHSQKHFADLQSCCWYRKPFERAWETARILTYPDPWSIWLYWSGLAHRSRNSRLIFPGSTCGRDAVGDKGNARAVALASVVTIRHGVETSVAAADEWWDWIEIAVDLTLGPECRILEDKDLSTVSMPASKRVEPVSECGVPTAVLNDGSSPWPGGLLSCVDASWQWHRVWDRQCLNRRGGKPRRMADIHKFWSSAPGAWKNFGSPSSV